MRTTSFARLAILLGCVSCGDDGNSGPMDGGSDTSAECAEAADCDEARGAPTCGGGTWACNAGVCEMVCPECEDGDAPVACYDGDTGTEDVGACHGGFRHCIGGVLGPCAGQVLPSGESCNAVDDDCDSATDEDLTRTCGVGACAATADCVAGVLESCSPGTAGLELCDGADGDCDGVIDEDCGSPCVYVAPSGDDSTGDGSSGLPFLTIMKGIAEAQLATIANVCVASGTSCPSSYDYVENIVMEPGISVHGAYESTTWTRPVGTTPPGLCETNIINTDADGVTFASSVTTSTSLDGFTVTALNVGVNETTAAVTVDGSTGAILSNLHVNAPSKDVSGGTTYGVNVLDGATPLITQSRIFGGEGSAMAVGVRSLESAPVITDNCDDYQFLGACMGSCGGGFMGASELGIRGQAGLVGGDAYGVLLVDSPGASVSRSVVCGAISGGMMATIDIEMMAGIRIDGDAAGTIVQLNTVSTQGGDSGHGIEMVSCAGAAPWIVANLSVIGDSVAVDGESDGIRAMGDCHPVIEANGGTGAIIGDLSSTQVPAEPNGIHCGSDGTTASRCVVTRNFNVVGSAFPMVSGVPAVSTAIRCDGGACARVDRNQVGTASFGFGGSFAQQGGQTYGILLEDTDALVDLNRVTGGCALTRSAGIRAVNASSRIENNIVVTSPLDDPCMPAGTAYFGVDVVVGDGLNEVDVHSNALFGSGATGSCTSSALSVSALDPAPDGARGLFRNNVLHAGTCDTAYAVLESSEGADPRVFSNNDLWPDTATALYRDENATDITDISMVEGSANLSADPMYTDILATPADLHLLAGSVCIDAGTDEGAPAADFDGIARPQGAAPDIGAFETP